MHAQIHIKSGWKLIIILLILSDICYTFKQFYGKPLDGDLVPIVLPSTYYQKVLDNPFGQAALMHHETYNATNRYFSHATMRFWFRTVHQPFSAMFADKVTALYALSALFSLCVYLLILYLVYRYTLFKNKNLFWLTLLLVFPLMQVNGMKTIALLDNAITYNFFYAFPFALLMLYLFPFYQYQIQKETSNFSLGQHIIWAGLAVYLSFGGTLIQPLVLLLSLFLARHLICTKIKHKAYSSILPGYLVLHLLFFYCLCLYSYYISSFNAENPIQMPSLAQRYGLWLHGLYVQFLSRPAYLFFLIILLITYPAIKSQLNVQEQRILNFNKYVFFFCLIYLIILPLGGYRPYRPFIIRSDLLIPVNFALFFYVVFLSVLFLKYKGIQLRFFAILFIFILFEFADKPQFHANACEKTQLRTFQQNTTDTLILKNNCRVLQWTDEFSQYHANDISKMLFVWKISKKPVYYTEQNN